MIWRRQESRISTLRLVSGSSSLPAYLYMVRLLPLETMGGAWECGTNEGPFNYIITIGSTVCKGRGGDVGSHGGGFSFLHHEHQVK